MTSIQPTALPDRPYRLQGDVAILDREGGLCRCGCSADEPFCDGSHARTGWKEDA